MTQFIVISTYPKFAFAFRDKQYRLENGYLKVDIEDKYAEEFKKHFVNNPSLTPFARLVSDEKSARSFSNVVANSNKQSNDTLGAVSSNNLLAPKDPVLEAMNQATANAPESDNENDNENENEAGSENEADDAKDEAPAQAPAQAPVAQPQSPIKAIPTIKVK